MSREVNAISLEFDLRVLGRVKDRREILNLQRGSPRDGCKVHSPAKSPENAASCSAVGVFCTARGGGVTLSTRRSPSVKMTNLPDAR